MDSKMLKKTIQRAAESTGDTNGNKTADKVTGTALQSTVNKSTARKEADKKTKEALMKILKES